MIKKSKFLIFSTIFVATALPAQEKPAVFKIPLHFTRADIRPSYNPVLLPPDFYLRHLGIICRNEWKLDQKTAIRIRFRLGSVVDCDYLEGKFRRN